LNVFDFASRGTNERFVRDGFREDIFGFGRCSEAGLHFDENRLRASP
jgi:hypothetical protein